MTKTTLKGVAWFVAVTAIKLALVCGYTYGCITYIVLPCTVFYCEQITQSRSLYPLEGQKLWGACIANAPIPVLVAVGVDAICRVCVPTLIICFLQEFLTPWLYIVCWVFGSNNTKCFECSARAWMVNEGNKLENEQIKALMEQQPEAAEPLLHALV